VFYIAKITPEDPNFSKISARFRQFGLPLRAAHAVRPGHNGIEA